MGFLIGQCKYVTKKKKREKNIGLTLLSMIVVAPCKNLTRLGNSYE